MLREAILTSLPTVDLGELEAIKELPGMVGAAAETLRKAWRSGLDLQEEAARHPRVASVAKLETAVLDRLPAAALRPVDIVAEATKRIELAKTLFGSIRIVGITELSPCWRPLLHLAATRIPTTWVAGPRSVPRLAGDVYRDGRARHAGEATTSEGTPRIAEVMGATVTVVR